MDTTEHWDWSEAPEEERELNQAANIVVYSLGQRWWHTYINPDSPRAAELDEIDQLDWEEDESQKYVADMRAKGFAVAAWERDDSENSIGGPKSPK